MKKILFAGLLLAAVLFAMAACNRGNNGGATPAPTSTPANNQQGAATPTPTPATPGSPREPVTITYANWNLGSDGDDNIERRLLQAFMDAHDWITVEVDESIPAGDWMENLSMAAAVGALPDVFMINNTAQKIINGWLYDLSDISRGDAEFNRLPEAVRNASIYGGRVFSVPFAMFMQGYFVNNDLFRELNLNPPQFGFSPAAFVQAVRNTTDLNRPSVGVNYSHHLALWYPAAMNQRFGYFTFDGTRYNLDAPEMIEAMTTAKELSGMGYTFSSLNDDQRETFNGGWHGEVFRNGQMALWWDGTWANLTRYDVPFEWDFIGVPGGRNVVVLDITGVAATTQHPYEAYLLAKWMGHGDDGFAARMRIAADMGQSVATMPLTNNGALLDQYWASWGHRPGLIAAQAALDNAIIAGGKIVPGHNAARYDLVTGLDIAHYENARMGALIHWYPLAGTLNWADHATNLNNMANQAFQDVNAELDRALR
jgi:multiple sugar transport system substrate-binding protein